MREKEKEFVLGSVGVTFTLTRYSDLVFCQNDFSIFLKITRVWALGKQNKFDKNSLMNNIGDTFMKFFQKMRLSNLTSLVIIILLSVHRYPGVF